MVLVQQCVPAHCGKKFRASLKKPSPNYVNKSTGRSLRTVPAFTIQAMQAGTKVAPPPKCNVFNPRPPKSRLFRSSYLRGEFPVGIEFDMSGKRLCWKVPVEKLDYHHYLPLFCEGLAEREYPYTFYTYHAIRDMINAAPHKVCPCVPQMIIPLKNALDTRRPDVLCNAMKAIQLLVVHGPGVGQAMVPYYRQILPVFNVFCEKNVNLGEGVDHTTSKGENVADLIMETLQLLEVHGGEDAYINIKYMVPTYESCILN